MITHPELYLLFVPTIIFVYIYNAIPNDKQKLNKTIIGNICGWNLLHVFAFFTISYYINLNSFKKFVEIVIFMVAWYMMEEISYYINTKSKLIDIDINKLNCEKTKIYCNPYLPRLDDLVFNFIGIFLYILLPL